MAKPLDERSYGPAPGEARKALRTVTRSEREERFRVVEQMLVMGVAMSRINAVCREQFGMGEKSTRTLVERVRAQWSEEERTTRSTYKQSAMRRLLGHIAEARREKDFSAIAQLERLLADMQGTKEALQVDVNVDATVTEAVMHAVAALTPEEMKALADKQLALLAAKKDG